MHEVAPELVECPLKSTPVQVAHVARRVLVDRTVGQVRVHVLQTRGVVSIRRETHDAFLEQVQLERPYLSYEHIDAHVPLRPADEVRVRDVLLDDALLVILKVSDVVDEADTPPSTQVCRLANPDFSLTVIMVLSSLPCELLDELFRFVGQAVGCRYEVVDIAKHVLVSLYQPRQVVFGAQNSRLGEVDQLLIRLAQVILTHCWPEEIRRS